MTVSFVLCCIVSETAMASRHGVVGSAKYDAGCEIWVEMEYILYITMPHFQNEIQQLPIFLLSLPLF
jgi:hypothetical protein